MITSPENTSASSSTQTESALATTGLITTATSGSATTTAGSTISTTVQEGLQQEVHTAPVRTPRPKFSLERLEKVIAALAKLIEAFAALSRARQAQAETNTSGTINPTNSNSTPQEPGTPSASQPAEQAPVEQPIPEPPAQEPSPNLLVPTEQATSPISTPAECSDGDTRAPIDKGGVLRGRAGFLWKPESDKDGKLAILLPPQLLGLVKNVSIISADGKTIVEQGRYAGSGNGGREHFRFSRPGGAFEDGSTVLITMKDGSRKNVKIGETSVRNEK